MSWNILVVDDAAFIREALIQICHGAGHLVVGEASDGEQAVTQALALQPDVIFMDLVMPNKNGVEAIREIKENQPNILIIACSSVDQEFLVAKARQAGAIRFLPKPFKKQEVIDLLQAIVSDRPLAGGSHV